MKNQVVKQSVGIDIAKSDFKVSFSQKMSTGKIRIKGSRTFKNTLLGHKAFVSWVKNKMEKGVAISFSMEATGIYHENLAYYLYELGYQIHVLLANVVKAYFKSLNVNTKTDKNDAKYIGQMGLERNLRIWKPVSAKMHHLKQATRERSSIIKEKVALNNRLEALNCRYEPNKSVRKLIKQRIKLLEKHVIIIEEQIKAIVDQDSFLKERIDKICLIKGLRLTTVATILAETNGFQHFTSKAQLVSYAGYDVIENQSGSSLNGKTRISKRGSSKIRAALHFPALTAKKHEPVFMAVYDRIFERTKIKMKAYVAIQRKLLVLIYTLFKNNVAFDTDYYKKLSQKEQNCGQVTMPAHSG